MMTQNSFQGVRKKDGGTEFSVYSPRAEKLELCLFSDDEKQETRVDMQKDEDGYWHAELPGSLEGQKYGYRSYGRYDPDNGLFFNPSKLLVDPYAFELTRSLYNLSNREKEILLGSNDMDSAAVAPKSVVRFLDKEQLAKDYPFLYRKPRLEWRKTHIYELHVGNFSARHPDIPKAERGKLPALTKTVNYFKAMSYNQIELMPLTPTMADWQLEQGRGLSDQWGYNPINHHAIDPRYGTIYDFLAVVNALHAQGIEVSMDMVFNHTGEFGKEAFLLSYKGLAPEEYYRVSPEDGRSFVNTTGCKNGFNPNTPQGSRLVRDSLMFFSDVCGVDAFRFDLAGDCSLDEQLRFNPNGRFMQVVKEVEQATGAKMSGEPWSAVGGYFLGQMDGLHEWNDKHEKTLKRFIRGENGQIGALAYHLAGSETSHKVNIFTKHDGATQYDWATYSQKNNFDNNENNQDGTNDNHYSPSANDDQRLVKTKSAHALNTLARGVPLSLSGDELWHTQNGNNNGYAISFPLQWEHFTPAQRERYLFERKINAFRLEHPVFSNIENASSAVMPNGKPAWEWVNINGDPMQQNDWDFPYNRFLGYVLNGQDENGRRFDDDFLVLASGNPDGKMDVRLPPAPNGGRWSVVFDTSLPALRRDETRYEAGSVYPLQAQSVVVLTVRRNDDRHNERLRLPLTKQRSR